MCAVLTSRKPGILGRLDAAAIDEMLDELDDKCPNSEAERRAGKRFPHRTRNTLLCIEQSDFAVAVSCRVPTRNISQGGLAFLYPGFVYPKARLHVKLFTRYGAWTDLAARVVYCRYVANAVHEVGVQFDQPIDVSTYCAAADHLRVLLVEDDPAMTRLSTHYLEQLNAEVTHVDDGRDAVEKAMADPYDLILMDIQLPGMDGFAATAELRSQGYCGLIVAATTLTQPEDCQRCLDAGCDRHLPKPYSQEDLAELLETLQGEPLFSTLAVDPGMADLLNSYVAELSLRRRLIARTIARDDCKELQSLMRDLRADGTAYGFEPISEAAAKIESALAAGAGLDQLRDQVGQLLKLCLKARAPALAVK